MSIFDAEQKAFKADQLSYDAREAINKCNGKRTRELIAQIEKLVMESAKLAAEHRFTGADIREQVESSIRTARYRNEIFLTLLAVRSDLQECEMLSKAIKFGTGAIEAAQSGDPERARRLAEISKRLSDGVNFLYIRRIRKTDTGKEFAKVKKGLAALEETLEQQADKKPYFPFKQGGTFEGTEAGRKAQSGSSPAGSLNRIEFVFRLSREVKCKSYCLVTVFHSEDPAKCGRKLDSPVDAAIEDNPILGSTMLPSPKDVEDGYVVDTEPFALCPCFPSKNQVRKDLPPPPFEGTRPVEGITGFDEPVEGDPNIETYYETAAVCFDTKPFTVLQTMRWKGFVENGVQKTVVLPNKKGIDWGPASRPFRKALEKWLKRKIDGKERGGCERDYLKKE